MTAAVGILYMLIPSTIIRNIDNYLSIHEENKVSWRDFDGRFHRNIGPARLRFHNNGVLFNKGWYRSGELHRINGAADKWYYEDGSLKYEVWYKNGLLHRNDGFASIDYDNTGQIKIHTRYINGIAHSPSDGEGLIPAEISYYENGKVKQKRWFIDGMQHQNNGKPSKITYYENGNIKSETWCIHGYHRTYPDFYRCKYNSDGECCEKIYNTFRES